MGGFTLKALNVKLTALIIRRGWISWTKASRVRIQFRLFLFLSYTGGATLSAEGGTGYSAWGVPQNAGTGVPLLRAARGWGDNVLFPNGYPRCPRTSIGTFCRELWNLCSCCCYRCFLASINYQLALIFIPCHAELLARRGQYDGLVTSDLTGCFASRAPP